MKNYTDGIYSDPSFDPPIGEIMEQEVTRVMARGMPPRVDRSDLMSEANEALALVLRQLGKVSGALVRTAIRRAMTDRVRSEVRRRVCEGEELSEVADFKDNHRGVGELVGDLPQRQYDAVRLVYYLGLTEAEAAKEMGCTQQVIHKTLSAAIRNLRKTIEHKD